MQLLIKNADIILPDGILRGSGLYIEDGAIGGIGGDLSPGPHCAVIDAAGACLMPGMIDIHSDQIEQVVEPRPGSVMDIAYAMQEQEKQLVNHGITTMFHSLSLWKITNAAGRRKAAREEGVMRKLAREIVNPDRARLITHLLHLRLDLTNLEIVPTLLDMLEEGYVSLLSFMDHTPGQGQYRDLEKTKASMKAYSPEASDAKIAERLAERMNAPKIPKETLIKISRLAKSKGAAVASHDDDSIHKLDFMKDVLHATISEFPVEPEFARHATRIGMTALGGAPNVLAGKSHSGNMSAAEGVLDGGITALCSDYYPPAMLQAVFLLHRKHGIPLHECVNLVTLAPARATGIDWRVGSIEEGREADLILVDASGEYPRLVTAICGGEVVSTLNYARKLYAERMGANAS